MSNLRFRRSSAALVLAVDQWTGSKPSAGTRKGSDRPTDMCFEDLEKVLDPVQPVSKLGTQCRQKVRFAFGEGWTLLCQNHNPPD